MSTTNPRIGRYQAPVLAVIASVLLLSVGAPTADASNSKSPKKPAARAGKSVTAPKGKITISLNHRLRRGNLIVSLDDTPIFNEEFVKAALAISQTTTWDPVEATAGTHKLTARVNGTNGKAYLSATYELQLSRTKGIEVRFRLKGDKLIIEPAS